MILAVCFVSATFLAWRDEHRKTIGKERRSILNKIVERSRHRSPTLGLVEPAPICELIELSDEFGSEEDVVWVCNQLDQHGHIEPFGLLGGMFEPGFEGKRLKFLQDARVYSRPIRSMSDALEYVHSWAPSNGLTRKDGLA
jgi:hypothetical protein